MAIFFSLLLLLTLCGLGFYLSNPEGAEGPPCGNFFFVLLIVESSLLLFCCFVFIVLLWKSEDTFHLKTELKILFLVAFPVLVLWAVANVLPDVFSPTFRVSLVFILLFTFFVLVIIFPLCAIFWERHISQNYRRQQENEAKDEQSHFQRCIDNPVLLESFTLWTMKSWCSENLLLLQEVSETVAIWYTRKKK